LGPNTPYIKCVILSPPISVFPLASTHNTLQAGTFNHYQNK
jgi:hypothetical protein